MMSKSTLVLVCVTTCGVILALITLLIAHGLKKNKSAKGVPDGFSVPSLHGLIPLGITAGILAFLYFVFKKIQSLLSSIPTSSTIPSWLETILWVLVILGSLFVTFLLVKNILPKRKKAGGTKNQKKFSWKFSWNKKVQFDKWYLLWILVALGTLALLAWKYHWYDRLSVHTAAPSSSTSRAPAKVVYQKLRINDGRNELKRGEFQLFKINWDEPAINFIPDKRHTKDTLVLRFEKLEDRSRWWEVQVWLNKKGKSVYKHITPDEPYPAAQVGDVLVCVKNQDATVAVEQKY